MLSRRLFLGALIGLTGVASAPAPIFRSPKEVLLSSLPYGAWFKYRLPDGRWSMPLRVSAWWRHREDISYANTIFATSSEDQKWITEDGVTREEGGVFMFQDLGMLVVEMPKPKSK